MNEAEKALQESGIIAIIRGAAAETVIPMAQALLDGGVRMVEVTMNTPGVEQMIIDLRAHFGEQLIIGAGTVTNMSRLQTAVNAGAQFIVTPNVNDEVISWCIEHDLLITPGAITPTDICHAMDLGCKYVKLFPASPFGPDYLKAIRAPLSEVKILVVGGISSQNLEDYLKVGAWGAGVGGKLCKMSAPEDAEAVRKEAYTLTSLRSQYVKH